MHKNLPTDMLSSLLIEQAADASAPAPRVPLKVYGVMAVTSLLTFATLSTGYQLLFASTVFA